MIKMHHRLILLILIAVAACQKAPDLSNNDGVPATAEEIRDAVQAAWGSDLFDGSPMKLNEKAWFTKSARIFAQAPMELKRSLFDIKDIQIRPEDENGITTNYRDIETLVSTQDVANGVEKPRVDLQFTYRFSTAEAAPEEMPGSPLHEPSDAITYDTTKPASEPPPISVYNYVLYATACFHDESFDWKPYCYNLKTEETVEPAPFHVAQRPDCGGLTNCQMRITKINYDLVSEYINPDTGTISRQKNLISLKISKDLPYLSRLVSLCFQGMGAIDKQPYVATVCDDLVDFERGEP